MSELIKKSQNNHQNISSTHFSKKVPISTQMINIPSVMRHILPVVPSEGVTVFGVAR
ncbi:hypothetical protein SDC9_207215 [bioreactor metagenome]|uniref:Uncharacterized protein n=1 Tax=bioreactor metagenome TaxID=1076179 RepID=A0A645JGL6_9ZZZZ